MKNIRQVENGKIKDSKKSVLLLKECRVDEIKKVNNIHF